MHQNSISVIREHIRDCSLFIVFGGGAEQKLRGPLNFLTLKKEGGGLKNAETKEGGL